jgi:hypothetical protein
VLVVHRLPVDLQHGALRIRIEIAKVTKNFTSGAFDPG